MKVQCVFKAVIPTIQSAVHLLFSQRKHHLASTNVAKLKQHQAFPG